MIERLKGMIDMARIEPNYRSNYYGRRAIGHTGRLAGRVAERSLKNVLSLSAAVYTGYIFNKHYPIVNSDGASWQKVRNVAICVGAAILAGAAVLKALAPGLIWLIGKMENIEVPPSIRDIRLIKKAFSRMSRNISDLHQFRTDLDMAATRTPGLAGVAASLRGAIAARNYEQARDILRDDLNPANIQAYNQTLAGDLERDSYGLDPKRYAHALYLATLRATSVSIRQDLGRNNYAHIKETLDTALAILDMKELKGVFSFSGRERSLLSRATEAAWGLSRIAAPAAAAAPTTPSVPPPPPTPPAAPSVPPPSGLSLPGIMGGPRRP